MRKQSRATAHTSPCRCDRNMPCEQCSRSKSECCSYLVRSGHQQMSMSNLWKSQKDSDEEESRTTQSDSVPRSSSTIADCDKVSSDESSRKNSSSSRMSRHSSSSASREFAFLEMPSLSPRSSDQQNPLDRPSPSFCQRVEESHHISFESSLFASFVDKGDWGARGVFVGNQFLGPSHWLNSVRQVSLIQNRACPP